MDFKEIGAVGLDTGMRIGLKILGAIVLWIVGRMLIGLAARMAHNALERQRVDITLARWIGSILVVTLNIVLVVAILGVFGVETTTLAAFMAAAGIAVGMAWSGLLSNFAAGAFLIVLRPFHAGDFVTAGGVTGTVLEVGSSPPPSPRPTTCGPSWATARSSRTLSRTTRRIRSAAWSWSRSWRTVSIPTWPSACCRSASARSPTC